MRKLTSWKYGSEISLRDFLQVQICKLKTKGILREFLRKWRKHPWNLDSNGRTTQEWFECDPIRPWCDHDVEYISIEISSKHWPWRSESEAILRNLLQLLLKYCRTATVLLLLLLVRLLPVLALPLLPLLLLLLLLVLVLPPMLLLILLLLVGLVLLLLVLSLLLLRYYSYCVGGGGGAAAAAAAATIATAIASIIILYDLFKSVARKFSHWASSEYWSIRGAEHLQVSR